MASEIRRSRNRIAGRKVTPAEKEQAILDRVKLGLSIVEIAGQVGKSRTQVWRIVKKLGAEGKVQLSETGRIVTTEAQKQQEAFESVQFDQFIQRYPSVKRWVDDLLVRNSGEPIVLWRANVRQLKAICDTLKISPEALIVNKETAQVLFTSFVLEFKKDHSTNTHHYLMALRNYAAFNGIVWTRGVSGLMSGKKVSYGQYAHIQLTDQQIAEGTEIAQWWGDIDLRDWFSFGCETGPRHEALRDMQLYTYEVHDGFSTMKAYESKTKGTWTKYFVNPTVQRYLQERIERQRAAGKQKLFQNGVSDRDFSTEINARLKKLYKALKITEPYFYAHPSHALRHIAAHHWLRLMDYNYSRVAKILGWKSEVTLRECYGEEPGESLLAALKDAQRRQSK
jgi:integrase/transposase-like protein